MKATKALGNFLRDVIAMQNPDSFRVFGPDETRSNRLGAVIETTEVGCGDLPEDVPLDEQLSPLTAE